MNSLVIAVTLLAQATVPQEMKVALVEGPVAMVPANGGAEQVPTVGAVLHPGDTVQTQADGRIEIDLPGGSLIRLGEGSRMTLSATDPQKSFSARLLIGNVWTKVRKLIAGESFQIETENGVAGVRGTEFRVEAAEGQPDVLRVYEGAVQVDDQRVEPGAELRFRRGQKAELRRFDPQSERGHKFMDWVRSRPTRDGRPPGAIHRIEERNPERENRQRERRDRRREK